MPFRPHVAALSLSLTVLSAPVLAGERKILDPAPLDRACGGACAATVFGGGFLVTPMSEVFGMAGITPPWSYAFAPDYIIGAAVSRRLLTIGEVADVEAELGAALRFGDERAEEVWGALYLRWTAFPWNDHVRTTVAVSTGLNYASRTTRREAGRTLSDTPSKLLHYFSPEITIADPDWTRTELVLRLHHRSGGDIILGDVGLFKGNDGGAQYVTFGVRARF